MENLQSKVTKLSCDDYESSYVQLAQKSKTTKILRTHKMLGIEIFKTINNLILL